MDRTKLQTLADEWTCIAKNDIRNKVISLMRETNASEEALAYALTLSLGELKQIIEGNGEISLSTFAKLLIATGNALVIKPIEDTPIGNYENIPNKEVFERPFPRQNVFARQKPHQNQPQFDRPNFSHPTHSTYEENDAENELDVDFGNVPPIGFTRVNGGRQVHRPEPPHFERERVTPRYEVSPFSSKTRDELVKIIENRLWESELDINHAPKEELVAFLDEKNRQMAERKRMKELEEDPKVIAFKNKLKDTFSTNPHLREWVRKFLGDNI